MPKVSQFLISFRKLFRTSCAATENRRAPPTVLQRGTVSMACVCRTAGNTVVIDSVSQKISLKLSRNVRRLKKNFSPANWMINLYWSNPSQLKCLVTLPYDLSLITIHISDWRHFSDSHNSQGSVATYLRRGGICKEVFVANLSVSLFAKEVWKSVNIWGIYGQELSVLFFWLTVYINVHLSVCLFLCSLSEINVSK